MAEADREQQREARRQKVLARSQAGSGGHRSSVVDLATEPEEIAPQGATAELGQADQDPSLSLGDAAGTSDPAGGASAVEDSNKSASRLAAERRRQRILSKSTERMAKVQGDRVIRGAGGAEGGGDGDGGSGGGGGGGGGESLDDMLEAAEEEFFGQQPEGNVAEGKPAAPQQTYFKSSKGGPATAEAGRPSTEASAATAQSKPGRERPAGTGGAFKPARSEANARKHSPVSSRASNRRPTGNKALDKQPFDLAAIQSLARAAGNVKSVGAASDSPARKRILGGVRFWAGLEGVAKTALLLLVGAGVGGLLLPEARATVAQAKFEAEYLRRDGGMDSRSRLESFLGGVGRGSGGYGTEGRPSAFDVDFDADSSDEFLLVPASSSEMKEEMAAAKHGHRKKGVVDGGSGNEEQAFLAEGDLGEADDGADGGIFSTITDWFLSYMDCVLGWAHLLSTTILPGGGAAKAACVPAIFLALLVRLLVASSFAGIRVVLGLPAFPPAIGKSKPGMVMGIVLAYAPMLGKVLALGTTVKSVFADTNIIVAGTVLTLTGFLAGEEDAAPRRLVGSMLGVLGRLTLGARDDGSLKEL